jgi:PAT family beta-lactamase induction signal transducer AmpG
MPVNTTAAGRPGAPAELLRAFWAATIAFSLFMGLMYGTRSALFMDVCNPAVAATQFTAYMGLLNLVISYSAAWQGFAAEKWGYPTTLVLDAAFGVAWLRRVDG